MPPLQRSGVLAAAAAEYKQRASAAAVLLVPELLTPCGLQSGMHQCSCSAARCIPCHTWPCRHGWYCFLRTWQPRVTVQVNWHQPSSLMMLLHA
jgi:hypothetical protein